MEAIQHATRGLQLAPRLDAFEKCGQSCAQRLYSQASAAAIIPACKRAAVNALEYSVHGESGLHNKKQKSGNNNNSQMLELASGRTQLSTLVKLLDRMGLVRSSGQKKMHKGMVAACLPRLFRFDTDGEIVEAIREFALEETKMQYMVVCPRRFGKTMAVSMFVAAYLMSVPDCVVSVFSTGRRASSALLNEIKKMVRALPGATDCIKSANLETMIISVDGTDRRVSSYPSAAKTLRGTGGDLIILEEAAYIPSDVFKEVVIPLLGVSLTSLVAITTPSDSANYCNDLMELKTSDGEHVFSVYEARGMCADCVEAGETSCPHVVLEVPPWKSRHKSKITAALYGNDSTLMARELGGATADDTQAAFARRMITAIFDAERLVLARESIPRVLFMAVDPNGGGQQSKFAIVTVALYAGTTHAYKESSSIRERRHIHGKGGWYTAAGVQNATELRKLNESSNKAVLREMSSTLTFRLCGIENDAVKNRDDVWTSVVGHVRRLRKYYPVHQTNIVVGVENCMGNEASYINHELKSEPNVFCLAEGKDGREGIPTTPQNKPEYVLLTERVLSCDALKIVEPLASADANAALKDFKKQLIGFKKITSAETSAFTQPKITYTGKVDGSGAMNPDRLTDDITMAFMMAIYWSSFCFAGMAASYPALTCEKFN